MCAAEHRSSKDRRRGPLNIYTDTGKGGGLCWHCHKCGAGGGAAKLRALTNGATPTTPRPGEAPRKTKGARLNVARAFTELAEVQGWWKADVRAWAERRGWPSELASVVAGLLPVVAVPADLPTSAPSARALAGRVTDGRRILFALHDAAGVIRTARRRFGAGGEGPKSMALSSDDVGDSALWGGVSTFGSIPDAVAAARKGESVYLVEGEPDWAILAAHCWLKRSGAVLGAPSAGELGKVAAALRATLEAAGVRRARVVLIPDQDRPKEGAEHGVGVAGMLGAAMALKGAASVWWIDVPTPNGKGDLADAVERVGAERGVAELAAILATAREIHPAPVTIADADKGETARVVAAALEAAGPGRLPVVAVPPGVGKTFAALAELATCAAAGVPCVLALPTVKVAEEKRADFERRFAGVPSAVLKSPLRADGCPVYALAPDSHRKAIEAIYQQRGRAGLCGRESDKPGLRCEHFEACPFARPPALEGATVHFTSHAMAKVLSYPSDAVLVLDESPARVETTGITPEALASLYKRAPAWWRRQHPEALAAIQDLCAALEAAAKEAAPVGEAYDKRIPLGAALACRSDLLNAIVGDEGARPPPVPLPSEVRSNPNLACPDPTAWDALKTIWRLLRGAAPSEAAAWQAVLTVAPDASWRLELNRPLELPDVERVLILDATSSDVALEWRHTAELNGRALDLRSLDVTSNGAGVVALHLDTVGASRPNLTDHTGALNDDAPSVVRRAIERAELYCAQHKLNGALGILTHKVVAAALEADPSELTGPARAVAELAAEVRARGRELIVGHYGADTTATNAYEGAACLLALGAPNPNRGAVEAELRALGVPDLEAGYRGRCAAAAKQAVGRARHLRRGAEHPVGIIYVGRRAPSLPGLTWQTEETPSGPLPSLDLALAICAALDRDGAGFVDGLAAELEAFNARTIARHLKGEAARRGWPGWTVDRRLIYAPSEDAAKGVLARVTLRNHSSLTYPSEEQRTQGAEQAHQVTNQYVKDEENQALRRVCTPPAQGVSADGEAAAEHGADLVAEVEPLAPILAADPAQVVNVEGLISGVEWPSGGVSADQVRPAPPFFPADARAPRGQPPLSKKTEKN